MHKSLYFLIPLLLSSLTSAAQIGEYRNKWSVGVGGGVNLNKIDFLPEINQKLHSGIQGGLVARYNCEKYFSTICSVQMEVNFSQLGWDEDITDKENKPVPTISGDGSNEYYKRTLNYIQVPFLAHLAWGKEQQGLNFYFEAGPQLGYLLSENTKTNFTIYNANYTVRSNSSVAVQDTMAVENKLDYGITAGLGVELHLKHVGRFQIGARYYYGLGNIYGDSKRDPFGRSNHQTITIRAAYLVDL